MEQQSSKIVQDLSAARDLLTPETWQKGAYFGERNDTLCMCAHGAVQRVVNPECKKAFNSQQAASVASAYMGSLVDEVRRLDTLSIILKWDRRSDWVRIDTIVSNKNRGNRDLHYLLCMVGLTPNFNDQHSTTLEMVKAKFNEAIELAKTLGI
jgi:hypothetical protein